MFFLVWICIYLTGNHVLMFLLSYCLGFDHAPFHLEVWCPWAFSSFVKTATMCPDWPKNTMDGCNSQQGSGIALVLYAGKMTLSF